MATTTATEQKTVARLGVSSGPDRGRSLRLTEELVHVGAGTENHLALTDASVAGHQFSIVRRGGRYAIYTPLEGSVEVDGNVIPHARWVWLPESARIRVSDRTVLLFAENGELPGARPRDASSDSVDLSAGDSPGTGSVTSDSVATDPAGGGSATAPAKGSESRADGRKASAKRKKKETAVAKFITDRSGEALVRLGEDGQLPELNLSEAADRAAAREKPKETNPVVLYGLLLAGVVASVALLLVDVDLGSSSTRDRKDAMARISSYYGSDDAPVLPWQKLLREARLAASRGDRAGEVRAYRRVLDMVNSEDVSRFTGLTGSPDRDSELRKAIGVMLLSD